MHIFIDESGNFVIPDVACSKVSSVTSLTIPDSVLEPVCKSFLTLRRQWGFEDEVKGSQLKEKQISDVITLLRNYDVLVEIVCLDMGHHTNTGIDQYKQKQADALIENLTDQHHKNLVTQVNEYRKRMLGLSNQLFVQAMVTLQLIMRILNHSTVYYSQRKPEELGNFCWLIDAKNKNVDKTDFEELWSTLLKPFLQDNYSMNVLEEGDYSYFARYEIAKEDMTEHQKKLMSARSKGGVDIKKLISEQLFFKDSETEVGLQLVDIVSNAFNRAMNGNLKIKGWRHLGSLMVKEPFMLVFDMSSSSNPEMNEHHRTVLRNIKNNRKTMLLT